MQMDLWVVAAATGAGYLAKYWKNVLGDKEGSSGSPSGSSLPDNPESPSLIQPVGGKTLPSRKPSRTERGGQCFSDPGKGSHSDGMFTETLGRDDRFANDVAGTEAMGHEKQIDKFEEYNVGYRLDADIPDKPEYNIWEMGVSPSSRRSSKRLRSRRLQHHSLQYINPRTSLDSCLVAQMQRERSEMEEYLLTPLSSPCAPALRPFLVSDGRQVISRASNDFRNELHKDIRPKAGDDVVGVPHLPQIIKTGYSKQKFSTGKNQMGKSSNSNKSFELDTRDGSSSRQALFCFGISIGVMCTMIADKMEVQKLKESLKQTENLVEDLQEELEMKDSLTVKELANDDDSQDILESLCGHDKMSLYSNLDDTSVPIRYADEESVSLEKIDSMSKIEAELEAELERLELSMKGSTLQGKSSDSIEELDQDMASELVHGELNADIFRGKSSSEPTPDRGSTPQSMKEGVSPRELSLRLHELIQSRLQERILELEAELANSQKKIQHLESEKNSWREVSQSESSSIPDSPMAQPLVMNLSGEALDAYNEAFGELNKLNGSQTGDSWIDDDKQQDNQLTMNGIQNGGNKVPPNEGSPIDYVNREDSDDDLLLIKQIVEKARRQGSPAILRAQRAMVWLKNDEN
ncbi:uncharacterized protein LOC110726339 [Chenopodium quinoa]|uniref:Uncharacterized protein n=1 Tax=Chenopodium quinoa TaxID=63459 RepID=A0A803M0S7_CHEQI|nr:uncharacterized protein LOC110726339 [Chenopodium quinoa]